MSPAFPARRRAEQFDSLVEGTSTTGADDARSSELAALLELVSAVRELPQHQPREAFTSDLRERLMAEAVTALVPAPEQSVHDRLTVAPRRTKRERRYAVALGAFALVGATTTMAVAAQSALPGDVLYPVKRAIENVHTGISTNDNQKGTTLLANASDRLDEVDQLSRGGDLGDIGAIEETLTTFTQQSTQASDLLLADYESTGDESSIKELRDFTGTSVESLSSLEAVVPPEARPSLLSAAQALFVSDQLAQQACPLCGGTGITDLPPTLVSAVGQAVAGLTGALTGTPSAPAGGAEEGAGSVKNQVPGLSATDIPDLLPTVPAVPTAVPSVIATPSVGGGNGGGGGGLPTGAATSAGGNATNTPTSGATGGLLGGLTGGLLGGGSGATPTGTPTLPTIPEVVGGVTTGVGGLLGGLLGGLTTPPSP